MTDQTTTVAAESTTAVDTGGTESTTTFSLSPVLVVCIGLVAACVGVWIGFKIAGGELEGVGCPDCADKHVEAVRGVGGAVPADRTWEERAPTWVEVSTTEPETVVDG